MRTVHATSGNIGGRFYGRYRSANALILAGIGDVTYNMVTEWRIISGGKKGTEIGIEFLNMIDAFCWSDGSGDELLTVRKCVGC